MNKPANISQARKQLRRIAMFLPLSLALAGFALAQSVPAPAPKQSIPIILHNGTIHTGTGEVIEKGSVLMNGGKIIEIGTITQSFPRSKIVDCENKHIYPALIAPNTQIGLGEIEAVRATNDMREAGQINPNVRSLIAYNTDSRVTPTLRSNGILLAQIVSKGGLISGTSSIVQLDAWNYEDAAYAIDDAVHLNWPRMSLSNSPWAKPAVAQKKARTENLAKIEKAVQEAQSYHLSKKAGSLEATDQRWEAMIPVLSREKPLFIHANTEKQIMAAVAFSLKYKVKMVLTGGSESYLQIELLKTHNIPVILNKTHSMPRHEDDDIDITFRLPSILQKAGILYCLSMRDFWNQRNLPFQAGTAVAYGLGKEEALQSITLNTAKILGIQDRTGSIEVGKDANIIVSNGDLLDMRTSKIDYAFIQGRQIDLGNKQKDLNRKFRKKYKDAAAAAVKVEGEDLEKK